MIRREHTDFLKQTLHDACQQASEGNVATGRAYLAAGLGLVKRTLVDTDEKRQLIRLWEGRDCALRARFGSGQPEGHGGFRRLVQAA
jgi:hypothetical protein